MWISQSFSGLAALVSLVASVSGQAATEYGTSAYAFDLSQVALTGGRFLENQQRTLSYLKDVNVDRMLYNFRANHGLSTNGAASNGGWDAPNFPFRTHFQGHFLNAWAFCFASLRDETCRSRAVYFVQELRKCQQNNGAKGYNSGYLSGFPESEFAALEARALANGNVPYYAIHKTLAGLLDVWRYIGDTTARDTLLALAGWVDYRTGRLSYSQMQSLMGTEFGGMNEVMSDIYHYTGNTQWLAVAQRFDHAAVFDPLASGQDQLNGLHANTQVPKWIGAAREFKATGTSRYRDIANNAWNMTVRAHTYAIGGNSQNEHFRPANSIAGYLEKDTVEACNTYNMLKLTRELFTMNPQTTTYFDFYERALINHLIGQQNPHDSHGHVTYFTPLQPSGHRGVGPVWGGGTWSTDYDSFWCCQGTGLETNSKLMDSIYFYGDDGSLYVNLFAASTLDWTDKGIKITQSTSFPVSDTTTIRVSGAGAFTMRVRVPSWATSSAEISVNGARVSVGSTPGTYASISRSWADGDAVSVRFPMWFRTIAANDDPGLAAIAYGPVVLSGNYGTTVLSSPPTLTLSSLRRTSDSSLSFTGTANGQTVNIGPFMDAHGFNYNVYFRTSASFPQQPQPNPSSTSTGSGNPPATSTTTQPPAGTGGAAHWAQCGGQGWSGPTTCQSPWTCQYQNDWYSQCL